MKRPAMAAGLPQLDMEEPEVARSELPDATALEDRMPEWLQWPKVSAGFAAILGFVYVFLSYRPVWHTDIWGHLAYGRYVWATGGLPATEPLLPLAAGMPMVDSAWLSQLIGFAAFGAYGVPALQFLYAASITACAGLLMWRLYQRTGSMPFACIGLAIFVWVDWRQLIIVRPQLAGLLCFTAVLAIITQRKWSKANWYVIAVIFALWANLHGSFPVGLGLLGCFCLGRAGDVYLRTKKLGAVFHDRQTRRFFLLTELAAVCVLLNPYGVGLYAEVWSFSAHPNLADVVEWRPLHLQMSQGQAAAVVALALIFAYRLSPRRVTTTEVLLLAGLGAAAMWTSRMILWWAPVAAYYLPLHAHAVCRRWQETPLETWPSPRKGMWTAVTVGLAWIAFAYTPLGFSAMHGSKLDFEKTVSEYTPVRAVEYLNEHPPVGQVFNAYEWGDYLLWAGPRDMQVFVASHAHLVPREVWQDYMHVMNAGTGWQEIMDRYSVNTMVLDQRYRADLIRRLKGDEHWESAYEDNRAAVFVRREPI